ncbi:MAG: DUF2190 family protein [Azoarcus sp.]|jgi:hypothetical protein|nr:DUF2190 family protein [Azoarcus sp.]
MKAQNIILCITLMAVADLLPRRFVGFDGLPAADGAKALGVVEAETEASMPAPVNTHGVMLVEAGGAIAQGAEVQAGTDGKAIAKASGVGCGFALDAATADGDLIRIVRGI